MENEDSSSVPAQQVAIHHGPGHGHLVIIGGGDRPLSVMRRIVELAGGTESRIAVIPLASEAPEEVGMLQRHEFELLGAAQVTTLRCDDPDSESELGWLRQATGVFFTGGDQRKLTAALLGTRLLDEIRGVYRRGGVVAGTSAGAAVMSRVMITGDELPIAAADAGSPSSQDRFIETATGFGFIDRAIIDQHFIKRGRHYRLLNLVSRHPDLLGIGIDEATAIVVSPDGTFAALGDSHVLVFDGSGVHESSAPAEPGSIKVHVLCSGNRYCLHRQQILD